MNCAFIHIPKTAGKTVRKALDLRPATITERNHNPYVTKGRISFGHTTFKEAFTMMSDEFKENAFKFCFSRNPFDRAVSMYVFLNQSVEGFTPTKKGFLDYTKLLLIERDRKIVTRTQCHWIENTEIDFTGKVENIADDLHHIADKIKVTITEIPVLNTTKHAPYQEYYYQETVDNIVQLYKDDFKRFSYSTTLQ